MNSNKMAIQHILALLDDESPTVQQCLQEQCLPYGMNLEEEVYRCNQQLWQDILQSQKQKPYHWLKNYFYEQRLMRLCEAWPQCIDHLSSGLELEALAEAIEQLISGPQCPPGFLSNVLSECERRYLAKVVAPHPLTLVPYIQQELSWEEDPNRFAVGAYSVFSLWQTKTASHFLQCLFYVFLSRRLGLDLHVCHFPHRILLATQLEERWQLLQSDPSLPHPLLWRSFVCDDPSLLLSRWLRQLISAYQYSQQWLLSDGLEKLLLRSSSKAIDHPLNRVEISIFASGTLLKHRRYGYRALVVDHDWDHSYALRQLNGGKPALLNEEQLREYQPRYYLLVHNTEQVSYVAHNELMIDFSGEQLTHPLRDRFFSHFSQGRYWRNQRPWAKAAV